MTTNNHIIQLPDPILKAFIGSLKKGSVTVDGIGTFSVTEYKKNHPSPVKYSNGKYAMKKRTVSRVSFKPHKDLKETIIK